MDSQPVSVEELQAHYNVSSDVMNKTCSEKHILDISIFLDDWRLVAPRIGLEQHDVDAVIRNAHKEEERRLNVFRKWKEKYGYKATYRRLIEALLAIGRADLAERVCKVLISEKVTVYESSLDGQLPDPPLPMNQTRISLPILGASGSAVTIASSIIQSVILISTNLNQEGITQQLGRILDQLHSGKVALGVVGLVNSGKSTTINAFIGEKYLPASFQPQTLRTIRIVSDHVTLSTLQGKTSSDEFIELARGQKEICRRVKEFNDIDRDHLHTGHVYCQPLYTELLLTAPINFLKDSDNIKLEIFETPGFGEFGCSTALSTSKIALKEMAALVLVVDIQSLFEKMSHDIVEQIQVLHPLMMKRHHRMLVLLNKYDICFDGNEESWSLQELCKKVSNLFDCQLLPSQIIPFSAKWALESRQWLMNPYQISKEEFGAAYYSLRRTPMKDTVNGLKHRHNLENVLKLGQYMEEVSNIKKVEERLFEMTCTQGPTILLESVIDDITREISELKEAITSEIKSTNISGRKREVSQQSDLVQKVTDIIDTHCKERLTDQLPADIIDDFAVHQNAIISALHSSIIVSINTVLPQLQGDYGDQNSLQLLIASIQGAIVSMTLRELTNAWPEAMNVMKKQQKVLLANTMAELKADLVTARTSEYVCIDNVNTDVIVSQFFVTVPELAPPPIAEYPTVSCENIGSLMVAQTTTKQRLENQLSEGSQRYLGLIGPKETHHHVVVVPCEETYRANIKKLSLSSITFGDFCIEFFKRNLLETLKTSSQTVSLQTNDAIKKISNQPLWKLQHELERRMKMLDLGGSKVAALESKQRELDEAAKALLELLP